MDRNPKLEPHTLEQDATCFCTAAEQIFRFLEDEYSYARQDCVRTNFKYWGDANASVRYKDPMKRVDVRVDLWFASAEVSLDFVELADGIPPDRISYWSDKGYARALSLDSLVEYLTEGRVESVLPANHARIKGMEIGRRAEKRRVAIRADLGGVMQELAARCKKYATHILLGDTSTFPAVQAFHTKKYRG